MRPTNGGTVLSKRDSHREFRQDHTCVVNTRPTKVTSHLPGYRPVEGKGYWAIRDGKLWIGRSHIQRNGKWSPARREFFAPKRMLNIARDYIKLEGGPPMKRPAAGKDGHDLDTNDSVPARP